MQHQQHLLHLSELIPNFFSPKNFLPPETQTPSDEKGLLNYKGENNCFLNVVIQSLWHLEPFRTKFTTNEVLTGHHHEDRESCVYCSLEIIFTQYKFSDDAMIPPTSLRKTMALLYKNQEKFQLFLMDDAAEAFEAVLACLHNQYSKSQRIVKDLGASGHLGGDQCGDKNCVAHQVFGINTIERVSCKSCGSQTEPIRSTLFTAFAYAAALRSIYRKYPTASFCQLISFAGADKRCCPNKEKCDQVCPITHYLMSLPQIFTISIVWDTADASVSEVESFLNMISWQIDLGNIFSLNYIKRTSALYRLRGMICYYGKHYTAYFYSVKNQQWFVFDDAAVKPMGIDWPTIRAKCLRGHLQPSMLFYECDEPQLRVTESMIEHPKVWTSNSTKQDSFMSNQAVYASGDFSDGSDLLTDSSLLNINRVIREMENHTADQIEEMEITNVVKPLEEPDQNSVHRSQSLDSNQAIITPEAQEPTEVIKKDAHSPSIKISKIEADEAIEETIQQQEVLKSDTQVGSLYADAVSTNTIVDALPLEVRKMNASDHQRNESREQASLEEMRRVLEELTLQPVESFIMLPSESQIEREKDFTVTRTNWLYRRQERIFRFGFENFSRLSPDLSTIREVFDYKDVFDVTVTDPYNMIIRFYSGKEAQYINSDKLEEILDILTRRSIAHHHRFNIKRCK